MKKIVLLICFLPLLSFTQNINLFDFYVIPDVNLVVTDSAVYEDTIVVIDLGFKVDSIQNLDKVYLDIKDSKSGSITQSNIYTVNYSNGVYSLNLNSLVSPFYGRNNYLNFDVDKVNLDNYRYFEIWAEDKNGNLTAKSIIQL